MPIYWRKEGYCVRKLRYIWSIATVVVSAVVGSLAFFFTGQEARYQVKALRDSVEIHSQQAAFYEKQLASKTHDLELMKADLARLEGERDMAKAAATQSAQGAQLATQAVNQLSQCAAAINVWKSQDALASELAQLRAEQHTVETRIDLANQPSFMGVGVPAGESVELPDLRRRSADLGRQIEGLASRVQCIPAGSYGSSVNLPTKAPVAEPGTGTASTPLSLTN